MNEKIIKKIKLNGLNKELITVLLYEAIINAIGVDKVLNELNFDLTYEFEKPDLVYLLDYIINNYTDE